MKIKYKKWNPQSKSLKIVDQANEILQEYAADGYDLSLRQLYYQFVARDLIPNTKASYENLGNIISNARDAGLIDWNQIQDRGRHTYLIPHYEDAEDFLDQMADDFRLDFWDGQPVRCQVWVEKEALADVVGRAASEWDVSYFPNKGYVSASSIWASAQAMLKSECKNWVIIHLGDHDPSGLDMTRDIRDRLELYTTPYRISQTRPNIEIRRIALNMDQIEQYNPPPNFAKAKDPRFRDYAVQFGDESWELDALDPNTINQLIIDQIQDVLEDPDRYHDQQNQTIKIQEKLRNVKLSED